jgi:protein tyrosine phosphatase
MENKNSLYRETLIEIKSCITKEVVHRVRHYYIFSWVDMSVVDPKKETLLMDLIQDMTKILQATPTQPIVVHCSAGVGRTGTLICLYQLYQEYLESKSLKKEFHFSIYDTILRLRHMRNYMVYTESQYDFIYYMTYKLDELN